MHVSGGDDANQRALGTKRERDVQPASRGSDPKSMEPALGSAVLDIVGDQELVVLNTCSASTWLTPCLAVLLREFPWSH